MDFLDKGDVALAALLGLLIGSFLNVVIHRLPLMMEAAVGCRVRRAPSRKRRDANTALPHPHSLLRQPRSRCPHCGHAIAWYENIPVLSYLVYVANARHAKSPSARATPWSR